MRKPKLFRLTKRVGADFHQLQQIAITVRFFLRNCIFFLEDGKKWEEELSTARNNSIAPLHILLHLDFNKMKFETL